MDSDQLFPLMTKKFAVNPTEKEGDQKQPQICIVLDNFRDFFNSLNKFNEMLKDYRGDSTNSDRNQNLAKLMKLFLLIEEIYTLKKSYITVNPKIYFFAQSMVALYFILNQMKKIPVDQSAQKNGQPIDAKDRDQKIKVMIQRYSAQISSGTFEYEEEIYHKLHRYSQSTIQDQIFPEEHLFILGELLDHAYSCPRYKKALGNFIRTGNKNRQSLRAYVDSIVKNHANLLVIRVDFTYRKDTFSEEVNPINFLHPHHFFSQQYKDSHPFSVDNSATVNRQDNKIVQFFSHELPFVQKDRDQLLKHVRRQFKDGLLGYIWRLEFGPEKYFHYHTILFLDGNLHQQDVTIAQALGEHWKTTITQGRGIYWNCNANRKNYLYSALGKVRYDNEDALKGLDFLIQYFTKDDLLLQMFSDGFPHRKMGKGGKPKPKAAQGRKRKYTQPKAQ